MRDDKHWAGQIAAGDSAAFTAFVDTYGPRLHRFARRYAATEADAEDMTQEIFVALYRGMATFRGDAALSTWAYQIALNHCRRYAARSQSVTVPYDESLVSDAPGPAQWAAQRELSNQVHTALDTLSPDHRTVVILHELQELTYAECAAVLQVPVGTVKSRLSYAFRHLRGALRDYVQSDLRPECE